MRGICALAAISLASTLVVAQAATVYRCTDKQDMVQSQLTPCAPGEKQEVIGEDGKTAWQRLEAAREQERMRLQNRRPEIGMRADEVRALAYPWGSPQRVNESHDAQHSHEQWVYPCDYLYFDDGILTSMQYQCGR